jgi:LmbE family N-acetylglucosaminyl deacetylase
MELKFNGPLLIISAHPDDLELMAGGVVARAISQNADVYSMVISDGSENGESEIRKSELMRASKILGIKEFRLCGVKDGNVPHNIDMVKMVESYIKEVNPSIIITHTDQDTHQDHKNVSYITLSAARCMSTIVLLGETPSSNLSENLIYFDISDTMDTKVKALKAYRSQIVNGPIDISSIKTLAAYRGSKVRVRYAEAFTNWRMLL